MKAADDAGKGTPEHPPILRLPSVRSFRSLVADPSRAVNEDDKDVETNIAKARFNMIQQQIRPWNVSDERVLAVMGEMPREDFVPEGYRRLAYADIEIPIDEGQIMLAPKMVGRLLQALGIRPDHKILEIGTGTGYVTACLARLGGRVVSFEIHAGLAERARSVLQGLGLKRVSVETGNALDGPVHGAPFNAIAVTGSLPTGDGLEGLQAQLTIGGRLFAVVGEDPAMEAVLITRIENQKFRRESLFETSIPALQMVPEPERFVF